MSMNPPASDLTDNDKLVAALSYFFSPLAPIIVLLVESLNTRPYPRYHALQSLGLFVVTLIYSVVACILYFLGSLVTFGILGFCLWILFFLPAIPFIYYTIIAYTRGQYFEIPVVTNFMRQQGMLK